MKIFRLKKRITQSFRFVLILGILSSFDAQAAKNRCDHLVQELKAMQQAQHQLLTAHSSKNELLSETMIRHAEQLEQILATDRPIKKNHIQNLRLSAKAFQQHEDRESRLVQRFEKASDRLLGQVQACMEQ